MTLYRRLVLGLWTGFLVAQGAVFAPLSFRVLAERAQAGALAGAGFAVMAYLSLAAGLLVVLLRTPTVAGRRRDMLLALAPAILLLFSHSMLRPRLHGAGADGAGSAFLLLHGAATLLYALSTAIVAWLWVREERRAAR